VRDTHKSHHLHLHGRGNDRFESISNKWLPKDGEVNGGDALGIDGEDYMICIFVSIIAPEKSSLHLRLKHDRDDDRTLSVVEAWRRG
jgi:hypothetical protein